MEFMRRLNYCLLFLWSLFLLLAVSCITIQQTQGEKNTQTDERQPEIKTEQKK